MPPVPVLRPRDVIRAFRRLGWRVVRQLSRCNIKEDMVRKFRIIVERYSDGYVGYPLGLKGVVVGQGDTYEEALADVKSAIRFHIETFSREAL